MLKTCSGVNCQRVFFCLFYKPRHSPTIAVKSFANERLYCDGLIKYSHQLTSAVDKVACCQFKRSSFDIKSRAMCSFEGTNVNHTDILKAQKDKNIVIFDVREDAEIQETGKLPASIHIPLGELPRILSQMSDEEFKQKYSNDKPKENTTIIVSCRSGKRSAMAQADLQRLGYNKVYNYSGGWLDWESHQ